MNKQRKAVIEGCEISEITEVELGGIRQKILIEGKTGDLPVVISLHGGPGTPIPFCAGARGLFPEFTDRCILVCWDQYGCGINNARLDDDVTISFFVDMTVDLIKAMKKRFPDNKLYLLAMSWGSVLSARAAVRVPQLLDGVIVYGQVLSGLMQDKETIDALMSSRAPAKEKEKIKEALEEKRFDKDTAMRLSKLIRKYTSGYTDPNEPKADIGSMILGLMRSPDYRFRDFKAVIINGYAKNSSLIEELSKVDLSDTLRDIAVPYRILQGSSDIVTNTSKLCSFVKSSGNKFLSCSVVDNCAHIPGMNGMKAVLDEIAGLNPVS